MTKHEQDVYGMSKADIREQYMETSYAKIAGLELVAMGVLSDAQELMACNTAQTQNQARQHINIAKFILSTMMEKNRA